MKKFTADFETAVWLEDESFVWAWACCEIGNEEYRNLQSIKASIQSFGKKKSLEGLSRGERKRRFEEAKARIKNWRFI